MNEYYVYKWIISDTGEVFYIGKGKGKRCYQTRKRNKFFLDIYKSHNCHVEIIECDLTEDMAFEKEKYWIKFYREKTNYRLTNQTDGGEGSSGYVMSSSAKNKISVSSKRMWQNKDWREYQIILRHSPESVYQSKEFKNKMSQISSGKNNPNYGNHWTQSMKDELSKKQKESGRYCGSLNPRAKSILCVETGEIFPYIKLAAQKYQMKNQSSISICLSNPNRTARGFHWREVNY